MSAFSIYSALLRVGSTLCFTFGGFIWAKASDLAKEKDLWQRNLKLDQINSYYVAYLMVTQAGHLNALRRYFNALRIELGSIPLAMEFLKEGFSSMYEKARKLMIEQEKEKLTPDELTRKFEELYSELEKKRAEVDERYTDLIDELGRIIESANERSSSSRFWALLLFALGSELFILSSILPE